MKCNFSKTTKLWFVIALCLIVVGMVFFGFFNFNKAVDNRVNYQVTVGVDQNVEDAGKTTKTTAESYFAEIGAKYYKVQTVDEGRAYIYTFKDNVVDTEVLKEKVQNAVGDVVVAECDVVAVSLTFKNQAINVLIALGVSTVAIMIYLLIVEKPAATFTVIFNSIFASILFFALIALTRIPVISSVEIYLVASYALTAIASIVLTSRLREISSVAGNEKLAYSEIASKGIKESAFRLSALLVLIVLVSLAVAIPFAPSLISSALCLLVAGVVSIFTSIIGTAIFWPALKGIRK